MATTEICKGLGLNLAFAAAILAFAVSNPAAAEQPSPTPARVGADFICHGVATQTCHFAVLSETGARTDFALASGETHHLAGVATGVDRYMVTINFAPPEHASSCSRTPAPGKRSAWCKLSTVSAQIND